jgi:hypothetical protein
MTTIYPYGWNFALIINKVCMYVQQTDKDQQHGCDNNNKDDHDNDNDEEEKEERTDAKRKKKKPKRTTIITESNVRQNDVLFGRGSLYNVHNKDTVWRSFVDHPHFKTEYQYHSHQASYWSGPGHQ